MKCTYRTSRAVLPLSSAQQPLNSLRSAIRAIVDSVRLSLLSCSPAPGAQRDRLGQLEPRDPRTDRARHAGACAVPFVIVDMRETR
eukprot:4475591-Pleurochrysis_carterae.AAC.3